MIADVILVVVCVAIIGLIVYGIYNKKSINSSNIKQEEYKIDDIKTSYVDRLKPSHLNSFYKLFSGQFN
ncbi:IMV membrane protein [Tanapox virus]|uniref:IMV membrane protein n=2 Tax=Tanapox virus TaxID=99000 RepID=A7XCN4_9POXV|nr:104L protein [Yaba-like disease virus]ABQ43579.1 IMV membrane protein [Tanapox virus]ABQ43734.1 IMV membrane protein [Tanapox virus]CAC21342.1 104L protein [Yaba-like disease virus]